MSITKEQAMRRLNEISSNEKDNLEDIQSCVEKSFGNIKRIAFIEYKGVEGYLVWDYVLLSNELTFIENISAKQFSLGKTNDDSKMEEVFCYLEKEYEKNENKYFCEIAIVYKTGKAREAAEKLNGYICLQQLSTILLSIKEYKYLEKKNQIKARKVIILGHKSMTGKQKIGPGMKIGYKNNTCVLRVKRSKYPRGKVGRSQFGLFYQKEMKKYGLSAKALDISTDFDDNQSTTVSMYNFLVSAFVERYMEDFLKEKHAVDFADKQDELCKELQYNSEYKKYITPNLLIDICKKSKFFEEHSKSKKNKTEIAWKDLYKSENGIWLIQRYRIKDNCRIFNSVNNIKAYGTVEQILCPILEQCHRQELLKKIPNRDWGIVFCGGGGKGAYQIGVWKWLIEHGMADKITGVSGASVGALNSLLFVEGNYKLAEEVWRSVDSDVIMERNGIPFLQKQDALSNLLEDCMSRMENICTSEKMIYSALTCAKRFPLKAVWGYLQKGVAPDTSTIKADYYCWASRNKKEIKEIVLASAAIPGIKQPREFEGIKFVDGGLADNEPVCPLVEDGFRNIIIVHLGKNENAFHKAVVNLDISNVKFYHVWPSEKLGGMLKAGAALTKDRIEQGYNDADKQLQEIIGIGRE